MDKVKSKLLADYKKANKQARLKILAKYDFKNEDEFLNYCIEIKTLESKPSKKKVSKEDNCLDVVLAFDTTGSMISYIESVRKHAKETVKDLFKNTPNLKMKIVAFGDYCDMETPTKFGKAYQESELTDNVNDLVSFIDNAQNTSGGDGDEFYELVIKKITEETPWRNGQKSVLLIADAAPHGIGYSFNKFITKNQIDWRVEAQKSAKKGIKWDTLKIRPSEIWYNELSKITGGISLDFANSNKITEIFVGTTTARASSYSGKAASYFTSTMTKVMESGDEELIGAYKQINTLL